ncbi:MAG: hypothetical protein M0C28_30205 [Candidatus Moduliflexus flocculans]|nr:hypothetical protein [Candidatus Moduliflexus flocculans]
MAKAEPRSIRAFYAVCLTVVLSWFRKETRIRLPGSQDRRRQFRPQQPGHRHRHGGRRVHDRRAVAMTGLGIILADSIVRALPAAASPIALVLCMVVSHRPGHRACRPAPATSSPRPSACPILDQGGRHPLPGPLLRLLLRLPLDCHPRRSPWPPTSRAGIAGTRTPTRSAGRPSAWPSPGSSFRSSSSTLPRWCSWVRRHDAQRQRLSVAIIAWFPASPAPGSWPPPSKVTCLIKYPALARGAYLRRRGSC